MQIIDNWKEALVLSLIMCAAIVLANIPKVGATTPSYSTFPVTLAGFPMTQPGVIGNVIAAWRPTFVPDTGATFTVNVYVNDKYTGIHCTLAWQKVGELITSAPPQCGYESVQVSRGDLVSYKVEETTGCCKWVDWSKGMVVAMDRWGN